MSTESKYNVTSDDPNFDTDAFIDHMAAQASTIQTPEFYDGQTHCVVNGSIVSIASLTAAAPDMLEVLQELDECAYYWSQYDVPVGIHDRIKSAIAKAKGEQP
jgi:hypothetical protein